MAPLLFLSQAVAWFQVDEGVTSEEGEWGLPETLQPWVLGACQLHTKLR